MKLILSAVTLAAVLNVAVPCSNLLVSPGASADGSTIMTYNADDDSLFGSIDLRPRNENPGRVRPIWDWDSQIYLGVIPEANITLNVVGNTNEMGVIITETTFGGRGDLSGEGTSAIMSYGDLIFTTLQRATSARNAIAIMDELCQTYGYFSSGESFGVGDATEVWLLELIGKGKYGRGAVWVASKIPDGFVGATANQARTTTFRQDDPENVLFSADVVTFAQSIGAYPAGAPAANFNFREAYDPISFSGARFAEARVWSLLNPACGGCLDSHLDFAQGYNLNNSMPLFVPVVSKLTLNDTFRAMSHHFEGTWFDNTGTSRPDVGGGPGHSPYRFRPLTWQWNGSTYLNERTVGVQQSGWAFIAQSRSWLPLPIRAVEWFAPDDSSTSPRVPVYGGAKRIPPAFGSPVGQTPGGGVDYAPLADAYTMSLDSAFWVWNLVGNIAFSERYGDAYPAVLEAVARIDASQAAAAAEMESEFVLRYATDPIGAVDAMTAFTVSNGQQVFNVWKDFWQVLFATYRDGTYFTPATVTQCKPPDRVTNCTAKLQPDAHEVGYDDGWRGRIATENPENAARYRVPAAAADSAQDVAKRAVIAGKRAAARYRARLQQPQAPHIAQE